MANKLREEKDITAGGLLDDIGKVGRVEEAEGAALRAQAGGNTKARMLRGNDKGGKKSLLSEN